MGKVPTKMSLLQPLDLINVGQTYAVLPVGATVDIYSDAEVDHMITDGVAELYQPPPEGSDKTTAGPEETASS